MALCPSFWTYGVYPFPLFSQEDDIHHYVLLCELQGAPIRADGCHGGVERTINGRNTVSRVLFWKRELNEFCGKLGEFCEKLGEFALAHR